MKDFDKKLNKLKLDAKLLGLTELETENIIKEFIKVLKKGDDI